MADYDVNDRDASLNALNTLYSELRDGYRTDFQAAESAWRSIEEKAQGNITAAGILVAGALAFINDGLLKTDLERLLLRGCIALTALSVLCAVLVLRIRRVPSPDAGRNLNALIHDLSQAPARELAERMPAFYGDAAKCWREANKELRSLLRGKVRWLLSAHLCLAVAIVGFVIIVALVVH